MCPNVCVRLPGMCVCVYSMGVSLTQGAAMFPPPCVSVCECVCVCVSAVWCELTSTCLSSPLLHTRSLCVCSAPETEGRPWCTITTKHIPQPRRPQQPRAGQARPGRAAPCPAYQSLAQQGLTNPPSSGGPLSDELCWFYKRAPVT